MKAVIIAAGNSSRLWPETNKTPKTLLPFGKGTILSTIMHNIACAGVREFVFVLGFKSELIVDYIENNKSFGYKSTTAINDEFNRGNGISVLKAKEAVGEENFILSMSDHIVDTKAISRVVNSDCNKNLLLVDKKVDKNFDIDDATKVLTDKNRIIDIGKEIKNYNCLDCGVFRLTKSYFDAMAFQANSGKESISAGIQKLIEQKNMDAVFMEEGESWIDIDTPEAYRFALKKYS